jgi:hypothetical protein
VLFVPLGGNYIYSQWLQSLYKCSAFFGVEISFTENVFEGDEFVGR